MKKDKVHMMRDGRNAIWARMQEEEERDAHGRCRPRHEAGFDDFIRRGWYQSAVVHRQVYIANILAYTV